MDEIILDDGKYRFYKEDSGNLYCYRNEIAWRDFIGDHAVTELFNECLELRKELAESRKSLTREKL